MNFSCLNVSQLEVVVKCVTPVFCQWKLNSIQKAEILRLPGLFVGVAGLQKRLPRKCPIKGLHCLFHDMSDQACCYLVQHEVLLLCVIQSSVTQSSVTLRNAKVLLRWSSVTLCSLTDCLTQLDLGSKAHNGATHRLLTKFLSVCMHMRACTCVHIVYVGVALTHIHSGKVLIQKLLHSRSRSFKWESICKSTNFAPLFTKQLISW